MTVVHVILIGACIAILCCIPLYLYERFGLMKKLFHDKYNIHIPTKQNHSYYELDAIRDTCKHCGKNIVFYVPPDEWDGKWILDDKNKV